MFAPDLKSHFWDCCPQGLLAFDSNLQIAHCNPAFLAYTNFTESEVKGVGLQAFLQEWQGIQPAVVENQLKQGEHLKEECWINWEESHGHFPVDFQPVMENHQLEGAYVIIYWDAPLSDKEEPIPHQELIEALNFTQEAVCITDAQLEEPGPRIVYVNPAFAKITGYTKSEIIGKTPRILQGSQTERSELDRLKNCLKNDELFEGETINYRKDGIPFVMQWEITSLRDNNGYIRYYLAVQRDLTAKRTVEQELKESESRLIQYLAKAPVGIVITTSQAITYANHEVAELVDCDDPTSLIGKTIYQFIRSDYHPMAQSRMERLFSENQDDNLEPAEYIITSMQGHEKVVNVATIPCVYHGQKAVEVVLIDISPQREAEKESRIQAEKYRRIAEHTGDMLGLHKLDSTFTYASPATYDNTGYTPEEIIGESPFLFIHEADQDYIAELYHNVLQGASANDVRFRINAKNGEVLWLQSQFIPIKDESGHVEEIQTVTREVTHDQELKILLQEAQDIAQIGGWGYVPSEGKILLSPKVREILDIAQLKLNSIEELIEMYDKAYQPIANDSLKNLINHEQPFDQTLKLNLNGKTKWIRLTGKSHYFENRLYNFGGAIQDVTEEKEAEFELSQYQHFIQKVTENSPSAILILDFDEQQFIYENGRTEDFLGYSADEINKMGGFITQGLVHPEDIKKWQQFFEKDASLKDGEVNQMKFRLKTKKGDYRWIQTAHTPFKRNEQEKLVQVLVTAEDVTEREENEKNLREYQHFIQEVTANTPTAIYIYDNQQQKVIYANNRLKELMGYSQDDFNLQIAQKRDDLVHPDDREDFGRLLTNDQTANDREVHQTQVRMLTKAGDYRWFQIAHTPFKRDENGNVRQVLVTTQDIHDWRQIMESHKWNENFFRQLVNNSPIALLILDTYYHIKDCNPAFKRLFGWDLSEIKGETPKNVLVSEALKAECEQITRKSLEGETVLTESVRLNKHGEEMPVLIYSIPVFAENELLGGLHGFLDISERKNHEKALREQTDELLRVNAELEQFAYITSHNLRSYVANITALFQMLDKDAIHDQENREIVDFIDQSAQGLNDTLNDLVDVVSQKNQGDQPKQTIAFDELLDKVKQSLTQRLHACSAVIEADFSEVPSITSVTVILEHVINELIDNALKFRSPKRSPHIRFQTQKADSYTCLRVSDNGIGFDANQYRENLFAFYKQLHPDQPGKGKGLYLLKYQIEAIGGYMEVESREDQGTTFYIFLKDFG